MAMKGRSIGLWAYQGHLTSGVAVRFAIGQGRDGAPNETLSW